MSSLRFSDASGLPQVEFPDVSPPDMAGPAWYHTRQFGVRVPIDGLAVVIIGISHAWEKDSVFFYEIRR